MLDLDLLYDRPDAHISPVDCMHYCANGPLNEAARVLQQMLLNGEI